MDIRQAKVSTGVTVSQPFMIQATQMQNCRMQVVHCADVLDRVNTKLVCCSVNDSATDTTPSQEHAEAFGMMIPSIGTGSVRSSTELSGPDNQRAIEESTLFQILNERRYRPIRLASVPLMAPLQIAMLVPSAVRLTVRAVDLHESDPGLNQPPRSKTLARVKPGVEIRVVQSVQVANGGSFP